MCSCSYPVVFNPLVPKLICYIWQFSSCSFLGTMGTNGLSALYKLHTIFQVRGLFCYIYKPVSCIVRRNSGRHILVLRSDLFLTGVLRSGMVVGLRELEARPRRCRYCATAPVKWSGIAEGPCGQMKSFSSSFDLFSFIC